MTKKHKNIFRFDQDASPKKPSAQHGWWFRVQRQGHRYSQFFTDNKYGGKEQALKMALKFRDVFMSQFSNNDIIESIKNGTCKPTARNNTGIVGVYRTTYTYKKRDKEYLNDQYVATWPVGNRKYASKAFSIKRYGETEAFRLAINARAEGVSKLVVPKHISFMPPENKMAKIWRYMDFTKFVSIMEDNALFFTRIDELNDPFEGSFSLGNEEIRPLLYKKSPNISEKISYLIREMRKWVVVNCWHMSDYESAAMWELYSKSEESICIQSTYFKLKNVLSTKAEIGIVQYADYEKEWVPEHDPLLPFLYKRRSFEHEREIRAILNTGNVKSFNGLVLSGTPPDRGLKINIILSNLVERVYVSPKAPKWFYDLVGKIVRKYNYHFEVKQSSLMAEPFY